MSVVFSKDQIVSSSEIVRHFTKYMKSEEIGDHDIFIFKRNEPEAVLVDYHRYEKMTEKLEELENLLEHVETYVMVETRKKSKTKKVSTKKLRETYGL